MNACDLKNKPCLPCEGGIPPLTHEACNTLLKQCPDWTFSAEEKTLTRTWKFSDFHHTMAFLNAIAFIAHQENHHPDISLGYNHCTLTYRTHAIDGLSENDFICAAKIDALLAS